MKSFFRQHLWWLLAIVITLALLPRGVVTETELNRKNAAGQDAAKWSEYLVYKLAAARLAKGQSPYRLDPQKQLSPNALEATRLEYAAKLGIAISPKTAATLSSHAYAYPPLWALLSVPLNAIGNYDLEALLWHLLIMLGLVVACRIAFLLCFEGRANAPPVWVKGRKLACFASPRGIGVSATVIAAAYLLGPVSNQQNDSMIFALVMLGAWMLKKEKGIAAGLFFGLAAISKGPLLLILPWLCFKRRWLAAGATLVASVAFSLLPDLLFPTASGKLYLVEWYDIAIAPLLSSGEAAASSSAWFRFNELNQSLGATFDRLFGIGRGANIPAALFEISDGARKVLTYASYIGLLLLGVLTWRVGAITPKSVVSKKPMPFVAAPEDLASRGLLLEISALMILACLLSPMTSPPHLCVLFAPLLLLLDEAWRARRRAVIGIVAVCSLPMLFVHKDLLGREIVTEARFYGLVVWIMLLLLLGLALTAVHNRRARAAP